MKIILLTFLLSFKLHAAELKVVGDDNYLPIIGLKNQVPSGILIDKLNQISTLSGIKFKINLYPWARAINLAKKQDVAIIGISKNAEREKIFIYSDPIFTDSILIVVKKGNAFKYENFSDLNGKLIGAQLDASLGDKFDTFISENNLKIDRDRSRESRLLKVLHDRIDVALIGNGIDSFNQILESDATLKKNKDQFIILHKTLNEDKLYLAFNNKYFKKNEMLKINLAIKKINKH